MMPSKWRSGKIAIIGEEPSTKDYEAKTPFTGSVGRVLDKALGLANIKRDECSLSFVAHPHLTSNLTTRRPNVVVALGEKALHALTGQEGITKWRGSILPSTLVKDLKVIPSLSPQWIFRGQFQHFWSLVGDLTRAEKQSHFKELKRPEWESITSPGTKEAIDFVRGIPSDEKWCLDIETRAHHLACFSIAYGNRAICIPVQNPTGSAFFPSHELGIWQAVRDLMARNPYLVGQNLVFDLEYLFDYGLEPSGIWMDTMNSHAILYPEFPKGLDFLCAMYTEMPYYKAEGKVSNPKITTQDLWSYNNKDTIVTLWCANEIEKQLKQRGLWKVHEFVTKELGLALEMQRNRLSVDPAKREELKVLINEAYAGLNDKWEVNYNNTLEKLAGDPVVRRPNVNSPVQVKHFIYNHLKLPTKVRDGVLVADETALAELKAQFPNVKELDWILEERHLRKLNSSYLDVELEPDGTLGGSWYVHGTETGRWTSGKNVYGRGLNLQTVPKAIRWMVVPPQREAA